MPLEVYEEIKEGKDDLATWAKAGKVEAALLLPEEVDVPLVSKVINEGYAPDLTDEEVEKIGRDPFLIAYALAAVGERCVVTTEVSKTTRKRANRHIPDVCVDIGVPCCDTFAMVRALNFSTTWKSA